MSQETTARSRSGQSIMPQIGLWNLSVTSEIQALAALKILDFSNETPTTGALAGFVEDSPTPPTGQVNFNGSSINGVVTFDVVLDNTYTFTGDLDSTGTQITNGTISSPGRSDDGTWSATAQPSWPTA